MNPWQAFPACPCCGTAASRAAAILPLPREPAEQRLLRCPTCSLLYKRLHPPLDALDAHYDGGYEHFDTRDVAPADRNTALAKIAFAGALLPRERCERIRILDIGCGAGQFVEIARAAGHVARGVDRYLPPALASRDLVRGEPAELPSASFDAVFALNVFEHLPDPASLAAQMRRLLAPGGVAMVSCPWGDSLQRRVYGANWNHLRLAEHLLFWNERALRQLFRGAGFRGRSRRRIAGSPFPLGRVRASPAVATAPGSRPDPRPAPRPAPSLGRRVQERPAIAGLVRHAIHLARIGDYLQFAIASG